MPYTTLRKLSIQAATTNPGTWGTGGTTGDDLNTGCFGPIDSALAGLSTFSVSSSNVSLTFTAGGGGDVQNAMWRFTGTLLANITVSPTAGDATTYFNGFYLIQNATTGSFTITLQNASGSVVLPQGRSCLVYVNTTNSIAPRIIAGGDGDVPSGSKTLWYNTAAPTGWTAVALNDYAIKIVTAGLGGVTSGSVAYSTLFARTATDSHTLTTSQIPLHTHDVKYTLTTTGTGSGIERVSSVNSSGTSTGTAGASGTGGGDGHTHNIDMRVLTAAFTLATRD
jgi:hypothetical protein